MLAGIGAVCSINDRVKFRITAVAFLSILKKENFLEKSSPTDPPITIPSYKGNKAVSNPEQLIYRFEQNPKGCLYGPFPY